jgi:dTDP-4-dehydrorhamnose reductase
VPTNVYGASKLAGEREAGEREVVVRTSWVVGRHGPSIVTTILRLADGGEQLRFVRD